MMFSMDCLQMLQMHLWSNPYGHYGVLWNTAEGGIKALCWILGYIPQDYTILHENCCYYGDLLVLGPMLWVLQCYSKLWHVPECSGVDPKFADEGAARLSRLKENNWAYPMCQVCIMQEFILCCNTSSYSKFIHCNEHQFLLLLTQGSSLQSNTKCSELSPK